MLYIQRPTATCSYSLLERLHDLSVFLSSIGSALLVLLVTVMSPVDAPWTKTPEEILQHFSVDSSRGLSSELAEKHAQLYGKNGTQCIVYHNVLKLKCTWCVTFTSVRITRGPAYTIMGTHPRTVQGPTCINPPRFCCCIIRTGFA